MSATVPDPGSPVTRASSEVASALGDPDASPLRDTIATLALLERWVDRGWLRPLDSAFARFLADEVPDAPPPLVLAAALASHQLGRGHVCLDLDATLRDPAFALSLPPEGDERRTPGDPIPMPTEVLGGLDLAGWRAALAHPRLVGDGPGDTPLVRAGDRLYLRRYWQYERDVRAGIDARLARPVPGTARPEALRAVLDALFPESPAGRTDWQKVACALAARSAFGIVTGGPGTGKTTTVVRLLALLQALAIGGGGEGGGDPARALRIRLAAPTGKAASRLVGSITDAIDRLPLAGLPAGEAIRAAIPSQVTTLHRLLGSRPDTRHFRHDADNPLALDVLVVDEASMIDLEMMAAVLAALPAGARLVLIGDKDQLASVEAGAVLGQLCARASAGRYLPATRDWILEATGERIDDALVDPAGAPLDQAVTMLRYSHRFDAGGGIGRLAEAVNAGDVAAVERVLSEGHANLAFIDAVDDARFAALILDGGPAVAVAEGEPPRRGYRHYLETMARARPAPDADDAAFDAWAKAVLAAHADFQVLCALRRGPWGVEGLDARIARVLHAEGLIRATEGWYPGRPVLVTRNDYGLGLMNGDIGITLERPDAEGAGWAPRVVFASADAPGGVRWVLPSRLRDVETVYALTVHKSQGSEFAHAALLMPDTPSPIATRELLYTGITRASRWLTLVRPGDAATLERAVTRRVIRASGLA